jgi:hypothetical protein
MLQPLTTTGPRSKPTSIFCHPAGIAASIPEKRSAGDFRQSSQVLAAAASLILEGREASS